MKLMSCDFFCFFVNSSSEGVSVLLSWSNSLNSPKMGASAVAISVFTVLWGIVGIVLPFFVPKGPNRGILQVILMLTAATCWLFWLCCYMAQMNPLIGPKLSNTTILIMKKYWG